jgi:hypothetical protein
MSLDHDTSSASTLALLDDHAFKNYFLTMMSDTGPETNDEAFKGRSFGNGIYDNLSARGQHN